MEFDFEEILRASERHVAKSEELQRRSAALVGRAESKDGRVSVGWTDNGLSDLIIDPRAMRLGSGELATEIVKTTERAKADLARQQKELSDEVLGPDNFDPLSSLPDAEALQSTVQQMQSMLNGTLNDTSAILDQLRKFTGR